MRHHRRCFTVGLGLALLWAPSSAVGLTDAQKCEASKLKVAGKYGFCRLKAEAKALKTGDPPNFSKCDAKLSDKWMGAETVAGGMCPTNGDLASMQAQITGDSDDVTACLNGVCPPICGDGIVNGAESCEGSDLGGETCTSLGYASGTLSCAPPCVLNVSGCVMGTAPPAQPLKTGQTSAYGTGSDGDLQKGVARSYTDNGDGTITDDKTGLMWEKKSDDGTIHDKDNVYTWGMDSSPYSMNGTMVTIFLAALNSGGGFAGFTDWRIPNRFELESLLNLENANPSVDTAFNTGCVASCPVTGCSCTHPFYYWSTTTNALVPGQAWCVSFLEGYVNDIGKIGTFSARAVRSGF